MCTKKCIFIFGDVINKSIQVENQNDEEIAFSDVVKALFDFARMRFQVAKVNQVEVYSNREGKRFLTKYESGGIKRIISLLNYLISLYNNPSVCLVVDELDAGIFEYLLGELIGVLAEEAKGQLIFTSHNLRVMEKLDKAVIFIVEGATDKTAFIQWIDM